MVPLPGGRVVRIDPILGAPTVQDFKASTNPPVSRGLSKRRKVINSR
jgi:hypothetical protein